jgi:hypothetical protein
MDLTIVHVDYGSSGGPVVLHRAQPFGVRQRWKTMAGTDVLGYKGLMLRLS